MNKHFKPPNTGNSPGGPRRGAGGATPDATTPIKFYIRKTRRKSRHRTCLLKAGNSIDLFDIGVMAGVKDALSKIKRRKDFARNTSRDFEPNMGKELVFDKSGTMVVLEGRIICRKYADSSKSDSPSRRSKTKTKERDEKDVSDVEDNTVCLVEYLPKGM